MRCREMAWKFKQTIEKHKNDIVAISVGMFSIILYLYFIMGVRINFLNLPLIYNGGDDFTAYANAKNILETGWVFSSNRLGAPFNTCFLDFPPYFLDNIGNLLTKFFLLFTDDYVLAINMNYYSIPLISFLTAYFVMQELKICKIYSCCGALLFALLPYYFYRNIEHFVLSETYFIPLAILLSIWCYEEKITDFSIKRFFFNKHNVLMFIICILIANNGIGYYPAFSCFFLLLSGGISALDKKKMRAVIPSIVSISLISLFFFINFLPALFYWNTEGKNNEVAHRAVWEADIYGLKISQMLIPQNVPGLPRVERRVQTYFRNAPSSNENNTAYLGLFGTLGFLFLLYRLLNCRRIEADETIAMRIDLLAKLTIGGTLLATIGGFGTIFAIVITPMLRCYNRISVFIAFISLLGIFSFLNSINKSKKINRIIICLVIIITGLSLRMQFNRQHPNYINIQAEYNSDSCFIKKIEKEMPLGAMIYQLPYHKFPETGPVNRMADYHEMIGFLFSKKLQWSYGSIKGRETDKWAENLAKQPLEIKIQCLSVVGFDGIYVDRRAYTSQENEYIDKALQRLLMTKPLISENKNLSFYSMKDYNKIFLKQFPCEKLEEAKKEMLAIGSGTTCSGFYDIEKNGQGSFRWMDKQARIEYVNTGNPYTRKIKFIAFSTGQDKCDLNVKVNNLTEKYSISGQGTEINMKIDIKHGKNIVLFTTNAPQVVSPHDTRKLYVRLQSFDIAEILWDFQDVLANLYKGQSSKLND